MFAFNNGHSARRLEMSPKVIIRWVAYPICLSPPQRLLNAGAKQKRLQAEREASAKSLTQSSGKPGGVDFSKAIVDDNLFPMSYM